MDFTSLIFELIDLRSFSNLWYWIMLGVMWSSASHWVLGVPFDLITRAQRHGGQAQADVEALARINTGRLLYVSRTAGSWLVGFTGFGLTTLAILGFLYHVEFAQAVLLLIAPMTLLAGMALRQAVRIEAGENSGEALFARLRRHRFYTQLLGMVSIFVTSLFGMWTNMQIRFPF